MRRSEMKRVDKPWGHELIWAKSSKKAGYVGKILFIKAGNKLSMQYHEEKEETIIVTKGILYIQTYGSIKDQSDLSKLKNATPKLIKLNIGETFHIKPFVTHRFIANETNVELIEVSTHELNDVVRISDDYDRA
jgi:D-lyxose ketol-isomerase